MTFKRLLSSKTALLIPGVVGIMALAALAFWFWRGPGSPLSFRVPGTDRQPGEAGAQANPILAGKVIRSAALAQAQMHPAPTSHDNQPPDLPGAWPQFRGTNSDAISRETVHLLRAWQTGEPRELWSVELGEGYAGPAVLHGRVYVMDYDRDKKQDALRCLSLADGREQWRFAYPVAIKRNHGMSRTVPAVCEKFVVAMGPKCHLVCLDPVSGELRWGLDLVRQYGTTVPPWYAGQCPLLDNGRVIVAPSGKDALLLALEGETGKVLWQTPNPHGWKMTHSSVMPMQFAGQCMYVYCANNGVVGVSAKDGSILWETTAWKISLATVPSPLVLDNGRIFLSGGYNAGSLVIQLKQEGNRLVPEVLSKFEAEVFGATQHTPIFHGNHIYGVRPDPDNRLVCLTPEGKTVWTSDSNRFGLGSFLLADGLIFAMNDSGLLRLIEATPEKYNLLGQAQVLKGRESWGPLALAGGRLLARDFTRLVCLDVAGR